ncbi:MAG: hypothetical protein HY308_02905 [Gammaproteobacteria bacterium]|nr:hypothetical protein [Gammaproteobacteria bacterium]
MGRHVNTASSSRRNVHKKRSKFGKRPEWIRVSSVNTQGAKSDVISALRHGVATSSAPAFAAFQESGAAPHGWPLTPHPSDPQIMTGQISAAGPRRSAVYAAVQLPIGRKSKRPVRNGQILLSNRPFRRVFQTTSGRTGPGLRPALAALTDDALVATVHEPSGTPAFAASQAGYHFAELSTVATGAGVPLGMVGDMNTSAERMRARLPTTAHIVTPPGATHQSGSTLDHGIFTGRARVAMGTAMAGDHTQQDYEMTDS